ncbi:MAG: hypothetical protein ACRDJC_02715 [Thermomicrobiales bacterium]
MVGDEPILAAVITLLVAPICFRHLMTTDLIAEALADRAAEIALAAARGGVLAERRRRSCGGATLDPRPAVILASVSA